MVELKTKTKILDLKMDLENLISCIECHKEEENTDVIIETMKTIVNICTEEETGKDAFREVGGLDFLLQFIIHTDQEYILEFGLKVLAFVIDGNVHSQMHLTEDKVFSILQAIFKKKTYSVNVLKNALVLFSTLLFQNRAAQDIIHENESLLSLVNLYKCFIPTHASYSNSPEDSERLEIWLAINSCLCFAVNNPLHGKNQVTCSALFPLSLRTIEITFNPIVDEATSSFLSLSIDSNEANQDAFAELDGFIILKHSLNRNFEEIQSCIKECNNVIRKGTLQTLNSLIAIIGAAVLDHEKNASLCGKLGIVSLMSKLLSSTALNSSAIKKILLVLGHCVDAYSANRFNILEVPKLDVLLKRNLETDDLELHSVARYLLRVCLNKIDEENDPNQDCTSQSDNNSLESHQNSCKISAQLESIDFSKKSISCHFNDKDSFSGHSDIHNSTSSQEDVQKLNESNSIKYGTKRYQRFTDQVLNTHKSTPNELIENDHSGTESLGEVSLQSAGHFYKSCQMNLKRIVQNRQNDKSSQKDKFMNCCPTGGACNLNASSKANNSNSKGNQESGNQNCESVHEKYQHSRKKLSYAKKKMSILENKTEKKIKDIAPQNKYQDLVQYSELLGNSKLEPNKRSRENKDENVTLSFVPSENKCSQAISASQDLNNSTTICKEKSLLNSSKKSTEREQQINLKVLSNRSCSFNLQTFPHPYTHKTNEEECSSPKTGPMHPPKTPGCIEVVVLPGATCSEHKLAAQFELLKVESLQTGK